MNKSRYFTVAKEIIPKTSENLTPEFAFDISGANVNVPEDMTETSGTVSSRGKTRINKKHYSVSGDFNYSSDAQSLIYTFYYLFGNMIKKEKSGGGFTYAFYRGENMILPTFQLKCGKDDHELLVRGACIGDVSLEVQDNFLDASVNFTGSDYLFTPFETEEMKDDKMEEAKNLLPILAPFTYADIYVNFAEIDVTKCIKSLNISLNNNLDTDTGHTIGSRILDKIFTGSFETSIEMSAIQDPEIIKMINKIRNAELAPLSIYAVDQANDSRIIITFPNCVTMSSSSNLEGNETITTDMTYEPINGSVLFDGVTYETDVFVEIETDLDIVI